MILGHAVAREQVHALLRADRERLDEAGRSDPTLDVATCWRAVRLARWAHYHHGHGRRNLARLIWHWNVISTGADVPPISDFGPGWLLMQPLGVTLHCIGGDRLTVTGPCSVGGGASLRDVGAGVGRPLLGDGVTLDRGAMVLGGLHVGDGVTVGPGALVITDVADGVSVQAAPPIVRARSQAGPP